MRASYRSKGTSLLVVENHVFSDRLGPRLPCVAVSGFFASRGEGVFRPPRERNSGARRKRLPSAYRPNSNRRIKEGSIQIFAFFILVIFKVPITVATAFGAYYVFEKITQELGIWGSDRGLLTLASWLPVLIIDWNTDQGFWLTLVITIPVCMVLDLILSMILEAKRDADREKRMRKAREVERMKKKIVELRNSVTKKERIVEDIQREMDAGRSGS